MLKLTIGILGTFGFSLSFCMMFSTFSQQTLWTHSVCALSGMKGVGAV